MDSIAACGACRRALVGRRFRCVECDDVICAACFCAPSALTHAGHDLVELAQPKEEEQSMEEQQPKEPKKSR